MKTVVAVIFLLIFALARSYAQPAELRHISTGAMGARVVINSAINVIQGSPYHLMNFKNVKVYFDYSQMSVCTYRNMDEYLQHKTRKKKPEDAAEYRREWADKTSKIFEENFKTYFDKKTERIGLFTYSGNDSIPLVLVVKFKQLEPHSHKDENNDVPYVYMDCEFIGVDSTQYVTYELTAFGSRDRNDAERVAECYAIAGKMLGGKIAGYLLKHQRQQEKEARRRQESAQ